MQTEVELEVIVEQKKVFLGMQLIDHGERNILHLIEGLPVEQTCTTRQIAFSKIVMCLSSSSYRNTSF